MKEIPRALASPPRWAVAVALYFAVFLPYAATISAEAVNTDVAANSLTAWRMAHTGQPWMDGLDLTETGQVSHYGVGRDGHAVTTRTPGQIWAATPFYLGSTEHQDELRGYSRSGVAAAAMTAGAVVLMWAAFGAITRRVTLQWGATALLAFATPLWSVSASALWTHPLTVLGIAGAALALSRERWWLVGIALAVSMTARIHVAIIAAVVGLGMAWVNRRPAIAVRVAVPTVGAVGLLSVWGKYVFDSWDPRGAYVVHSVSKLVPGAVQGGPGYLENLAGFLFSADRGLFVWTPLLLLLLPAVVRGFARAPAWTRYLAVGGVVYGLAQVGLNVFHGGDAFYGYRLALESLVSVTPLYVATAHRAGPLARISAPLVIGVQAAAVTLGSVFEGLMLLVPDDDAWSRNALFEGFDEVPGLIPAFVLIAGLVAVLSFRIINGGGGARRAHEAESSSTKTPSAAARNPGILS